MLDLSQYRCNQYLNIHYKNALIKFISVFDHPEGVLNCVDEYLEQNIIKSREDLYKTLFDTSVYVIADKYYNQPGKIKFAIRKRIAEYKLTKTQYPLELTLMLTGRCNLRCDHCLADEIPKEDLDIKKVIKSLTDSPLINEITICGGEPMLHKDFKQFVIFASKIASFVNIDTNATLFSTNYDELEESLKWLPKNCKFIISFDNYHFGGKFKLTGTIEMKIKNLLKFVINHKIELAINVVDEKNQIPAVKDKELAKILDDITNEQYKHSYIVYRGKPVAIGKAIGKSERKLSIMGIQNSLHSLALRFTINPDGKVFTGMDEMFLEPMNKQNKKYIGDINKESIHTLYEKEFRAVLLRTRDPELLLPRSELLRKTVRNKYEKIVARLVRNKVQLREKERDTLRTHYMNKIKY